MRYARRNAATLILPLAALLQGGRVRAEEAKTPPPAGTPKDAPRQAGFAGIESAPIDADERADYGLKPDQAGVVVLEVVKDGPAEKAGVKAGDILVAVNGKPCASPEMLTQAVRGLAPGAQAALELLREGKPLAVTMTVGAAPDAAQAPDPKQRGEMQRQREAMLAMLPPEMRAKMRELQGFTEKKVPALVKQYMADGLSEEEARMRAHKDLQADPEFQKLQQEIQEITQKMGR